MPPSQEEFDLGRSDLTVPLANLLWSFPDKAFTPEKLLQLLTDTEGRNATIEDILQALKALVDRERIRTKEIAGQTWYNMPRRRLGFLTE
jgi:hypothetical protein